MRRLFLYNGTTSAWNYIFFSSLPDPESRRKSRIDQVFELLQANHLSPFDEGP